MDLKGFLQTSKDCFLIVPGLLFLGKNFTKRIFFNCGQQVFYLLLVYSQFWHSLHNNNNNKLHVLVFLFRFKYLRVGFFLI